MFYEVAITLVFLVHVTYQDKLMSKTNLMHYFDQSKDFHGYDKSKIDDTYKYLKKWFDKNHRFKGNRNSNQPRFFKNLDFIIPHDGIRHPVDHQPRTLDLTLSYPGFHNLIEVRGPIRKTFIPKKYDMPDIHNKKTTKQNKNKMKTSYNVPLELWYHQPRLSYAQDGVSISKEGFIEEGNSHNSKKVIPQSRRYINSVLTKTAVAYIAEWATTPSNQNSFAALELSEKIDPLPFKQVKRNKDPDSDEDEDDEESKYMSFY